jgi:hypothetical protein
MRTALAHTGLPTSAMTAFGRTRSRELLRARSGDGSMEVDQTRSRPARLIPARSRAETVVGLADEPG